MTIRCFLVFLLVGCTAQAYSQSDTSRWAMDAEANMYFFPGGERIFLPTFKADKGWFHGEARYNYEDLNTFSAWIGYNFQGGDKLVYDFKPMLGALTGNTKGVALGFEGTFTLGKFELYTEGEFVSDNAAVENNFFYSWTDLAFSPREWWWLGYSGQRTKLYQTDVDFQHGLFVGAELGGIWSITSYAYNIHRSEPFVLFTIAAEF